VAAPARVAEERGSAARVAPAATPAVPARAVELLEAVVWAEPEAVGAPRRLPSSALVSLARDRLRRSAGGRIGALGAVGVLLFALVTGAVLVDSPSPVDLPGFVVRSVRWLLWLGVGPLALAIANGRPERDRADGVEALASLRGHQGGALESARLLAAVMQTSLRIGVPAVFLCLLLALLSRRDADALLVQALGLGAFAMFGGLLVGGTAALCGRVAGRRGRGALLAVVLIPWVVSGGGWRAEWSLPALVDLGLLAAVDATRLVEGGR